MKNIVYIDHFDSFANTIAAYFRMAGADVDVYKSTCDLDAIAAKDPDLILLGPGPSGPKEAGNYMEAIERFHRTHPMFGICLGFQAMMQYFGEEVVQLEEAVHGAASRLQHTGTHVFEGIENPAEFARYHSLGAYGVPESFMGLAHFPDTNGKHIVMAAHHKELPIAGVQFHPESILSSENRQGEQLIKNVLYHLAGAPKER